MGTSAAYSIVSRRTSETPVGKESNIPFPPSSKNTVPFSAMIGEDGLLITADLDAWSSTISDSPKRFLLTRVDVPNIMRNKKYNAG